MGLFFNKMEVGMTFKSVAIIAGVFALLALGIAFVCGVKFLVGIGVSLITFVVMAVIVVIVAAYRDVL
jgi:hypothetical protein